MADDEANTLPNVDKPLLEKNVNEPSSKEVLEQSENDAVEGENNEKAADLCSDVAEQALNVISRRSDDAVAEEVVEAKIELEKVDMDAVNVDNGTDSVFSSRIELEKIGVGAVDGTDRTESVIFSKSEGNDDETVAMENAVTTIDAKIELEKVEVEDINVACPTNSVVLSKGEGNGDEVMAESNGDETEIEMEKVDKDAVNVNVGTDSVISSRSEASDSENGVEAKVKLEKVEMEEVNVTAVRDSVILSKGEGNDDEVMAGESVVSIDEAKIELEKVDTDAVNVTDAIDSVVLMKTEGSDESLAEENVVSTERAKMELEKDGLMEVIKDKVDSFKHDDAKIVGSRVMRCSNIGDEVVTETDGGTELTKDGPMAVAEPGDSSQCVGNGAEAIEATRNEGYAEAVIEGSLSAAEARKDGRMEAMKHGKTEAASILDDSELFHKAMSAAVETETAEGSVAPAEARVEVAKDGTMGVVTKPDEIEPTSELKKDGVMDATRQEVGSSDIEATVVTRNEEKSEAVREGDFSTVEATIGEAQHEVLDIITKEQESREDEVMCVEGEAANAGHTDVLNEVEKNDEVVAEADLSTADVEMDATKHEEVEPDSSQQGALLDEEDEEALVVEEETANVDTEMETETETDTVESAKASGGKRKRRSCKSPGNTDVVVARASSRRKTVGEDVCFICFDGGDLVLCDRRGCPKAYHPSCVNRDEAFFQTKGRWNCGWHQCSICEKNAHYMCYMCTYSLCKGCLKNADVILCIRGGNKGFCETCMKIVKLIESNGQWDKDAPVDFDDKSCWEYLFKDYFVDLKTRLSLSSEEIANAKSPLKGSDEKSVRKHKLADPHYNNNDDGASGSDDSMETLEPRRSKRRSSKRLSKSLQKDEDSTTSGTTGFSTAGTTEWASKELLEFIKHMKSGEASVISQFDVQALLLEYIKTKKLRDPRRKSQIICDSRLERLFGKARVGHFEMLKLLESHFLTKEDDSQTGTGTIVDNQVNDIEADANAETPASGGKDRKRKRKKGERSGPQSNLEDYAAIDVHNIGLIYLRRKLFEDLLGESDKFNERVVGTFVRIRISGSAQKQELYRLVQVVGTSKAAGPYKLGKRTTDIGLEILNLNKREVVLIDTLSNQEFTEEECKRLRQSIKCGFINRLTVGDILDKAMEIHTARVDDWLESEILRLSHLRDRASEKGRRKELRECVEKLQLLKTPDERRHRLDEVPEVHADPHMDPSYESEDEGEKESRQDAYTRSREANFSRRGWALPVSPRSNFSPKDSWGGSGGGKIQPKNRGEEVIGSLSRKTVSSNTEVAVRASEIANENALKDLETESPATLPVLMVNESEKIWHYKDPSGKIQGPFSMVQLRKWSNTGYFPADLKIWRITEKEDESIVLTDALAGKFEKKLPPTPHVNHNHGSEKSTGISSSERWSNSGSFNLPSPTPLRGSENNVNSGMNFVTVPNSRVGPTAGSTNPNVNGMNSSPLVPQPDNRIAQTQGSGQSNVQLPSVPTGPWGVGPSENMVSVSAIRPPENQNTGWGMVPGNPNVTWSGQVPAAMSMNWGPTVQANPGSVVPTVPVSGNTNQGWVPPVGVPAVNGMVPGNANQGWVAPTVNMGSTVQGHTPGSSRWGPPLGDPNANQGWGPSAASQGTRNNEHHLDGGNMGNSHGGSNSGYNDDRWNRQSSFGSRQTGGGSFRKSNIPCPYNANGRCVKGSRCDYLHS